MWRLETGRKPCTEGSRLATTVVRAKIGRGWKAAEIATEECATEQIEQSRSAEDLLGCT